MLINTTRAHDLFFSLDLIQTDYRSKALLQNIEQFYENNRLLSCNHMNVKVIYDNIPIKITKIAMFLYYHLQ